MPSPATIVVEFRGRRRSVDPDRPLTTSLTDDQLPRLQRSVRYHRPRSPFCGVGYCTQCLIRVNGVPNVRACRYRPRSGDVIETENAWPSPRHDLLGVLDVVFSRGIDTVHGFRRPAFLTPLYHRVVRRLAGYGTLPKDRGRLPAFASRREPADVLIVGGGTAGGRAVRTLTEAGASILVVDREGLSGTGPPEVAARTSTVVFLPPRSPTGDRPFHAVVGDGAGAGWAIDAKSVILAPGGYDANLVFTGNDRPGVLTAEAAERLVADPKRPPFRHAITVGGGTRALDMLHRFGPHIEAVVAPGSIEPEVTRAASDLGVPLYPRTLVLSASGRSRIRSVRLRARGGSANPFSLTTDTVLLAHRRLPSVQLFFQAGARMHWDAAIGHYLPDHDADGRTTIPGLFAVGEAAGYGEPSSAEESGARAARAIVSGLDPWTPPSSPGPSSRPSDLETYYREVRGSLGQTGKCVVCPCEDVLWSEVEEAHRAGYRGIEVIKRFTGAGTGLCQGRYCIPELLLLLAPLENRPAPEVGYITQRPPVVPVSLSALARLPEGD
ncbi:MAG: 2Fe-2S iron-sulfur cluster-binding protein [Thermoplasmata archaeon]